MHIERGLQIFAALLRCYGVGNGGAQKETAISRDIFSLPRDTEAFISGLNFPSGLVCYAGCCLTSGASCVLSRCQH